MQQKLGPNETPTEFLVSILGAILLLIVGERGEKMSSAAILAYVMLALGMHLWAKVQFFGCPCACLMPNCLIRR